MAKSPRARRTDLDLVRASPYGPAACDPPHQKAGYTTAPDHIAPNCPKKTLAFTGASIHGHTDWPTPPSGAPVVPLPWKSVGLFVGWTWPVPTRGRPDAHRLAQVRTALVPIPRLLSSSPGLEVSRGDFLQNLIVHRQTRHQLLQPAILLLQRLQTLGLIHPQTPVRLPPPVVGLLSHPRSAYTPGLPSSLGTGTPPPLAA